MKYSKTEVRRQKSEIRRNILSFLFVLTLMVCTQSSALPLWKSEARSASLSGSTQTSDLRVPEQLVEEEHNIPSILNIKDTPAFPNTLKNGHRISLSDSTVSLSETPLVLAIDETIDFKEVMAGDYFKAHAFKDFYIQTSPPRLVIPKGTWFRGKISSVKKPSLFNRSGKIKLRLDQLGTPLGELVILNAKVNLQTSTANSPGALSVTVEANKLGARTLGDLLSGELVALYSQENKGILYKGQELQIVLNKNLNIKN